jgi:uncharacterized lipoprotein NlpE involved in copper resistance
MRVLLTVAFAMFLAGCVSQEDRMKAEIADCTELGFQPGTESFANCRLQIRGQRIAKMGAAAAIMNANQQNKPRTCTGYGASVTCY